MNKRSIKKGLLQGAAVLVLGSQSLVYAQSSVPSAPAAPAAAPAESTAPAAPPASSPASAAPPAASDPAPSGAKVIYIASEMRFAENTFIDPAVTSECRLTLQGVELLETAAKEAGIQLVRSDEAVKAAKGRVFVVVISQVLSTGNAFTGHRKQVGVVGRLMDGDKEIAVFRGARNSMGGA